MYKPQELMSNGYHGPSRLLPLGHIRNIAGFAFVGVDKSGGLHDCIVQAGDGGLYYVSSDTVSFGDLCGWLPKSQDVVEVCR